MLIILPSAFSVWAFECFCGCGDENRVELDVNRTSFCCIALGVTVCRHDALQLAQNCSGLANVEFGYV